MTCTMTSVGKKIWVAITGLGLSGFVLMHMLGNLLILVGPEAYNKYGHAIVSNPLLYAAEAGLVVMFIVHIYLAITLNLANRKARPKAPAERANCQKAARFGSQYMVLTGLLVFVFVVLHLITFKYGTHYSVTYNGIEMRDLHRLIIEEFHKPVYVVWYLFAMVILGVHLAHGASALAQSLGLGSVRNRCLKQAGWAFAAVVALGFSSQAVYSYFYQGSN